ICVVRIGPSPAVFRSLVPPQSARQATWQQWRHAAQAGSSTHCSRTAPSGARTRLLAGLDAVGAGNQTDRLIRADVPDIDLAIGKNDRHAWADANGDDARRLRACAFERPALEVLEVRRFAPRRGASGIDECREVPALAHHERELRTLRLPFGAE